jgi:amidase
LLQPGFSAGGASGKQIKVGRLNIPGTDPKIEQAIDEALKAAGFRVVPLGDEFRTAWDQAQSNGTTIAVADGWVSDQQYQDKPGVSSTTKATIALGQLQYNTVYKGALDARRAWRRELSRVFDKVDFIALPTVKSLPPHRGLFERSVLFEARVLALQNTVAVNYAGNPAIAIPIPYPDEDFRATSLQLVGRRLDEGGLVNAARIVMDKAPVTLKTDRH